MFRSSSRVGSLTPSGGRSPQGRFKWSSGVRRSTCAGITQVRVGVKYNLGGIQSDCLYKLQEQMTTNDDDTFSNFYDNLWCWAASNCIFFNCGLIMGQNECCAQKQLHANAEYNPNLRKPRKSVPKKQALDLLSASVRKKREQLQQYTPKNTSCLPSGIFSDTYEESLAPKGYYHGEWQQDKFNGKGEFFFKDGAYYQGYFLSGEAAIQGRYIFNNGCYYQGEIENGEAQGDGNYIDPYQNYEYSGSWERDKPHGKGVEKFGNGSYYQGNFKNGVKDGYGHYVCQSGVYEGNFKDGNFSGQGTFSYTDSRTYKGQWSQGMLSGYGIFTWPDGNRYEGQYSKGLKHGRGTFFFSNGKIFRGTWLKGLKHGAGQLKINNQIIKGIWKQGQLQNAVDDNQLPEE